MARNKKIRNLQLKGKQWQFRKRLGPALEKALGKKWYIQNLSTSDLIRAGKIRDDIEVELARREAKAARSENALTGQEEELEIYASLQTLSEHDRYGSEGYSADLGEETESKGQDEIGRYRRVTCQTIPITLHLDRYQRELTVVETTKKARRLAVEKFAKTLSDPTLQVVTKRKAGEYASRLISEGLAPKTVNSHLSHLSGYWKWLVKRGIGEENPWAGQQISGDVIVERHAWSIPEVIELIQKAPDELLSDAIAIAALSGLRAGEVAALTVGDCKDGFFKIRKGKTEAAKRNVPIHSQLKAIVVRRSKGKAATEFLLNEIGGDSDSLSKRFGRYRDKMIGKTEGRQSNKTFHSLRHHFNHIRLNANVQERIMQELMGHALEGVNLGVYYHGRTDEQAIAAVEAVSLPVALEAWEK